MTTQERMAYVPGATQFTYDAQEIRTEEYRTWHGRQGMDWCWECLLCGDWGSSEASREAAVNHAAKRHQTYCHVVQGCHCPQPHITATHGARLGLADTYPYNWGGVLLRLAGGQRVYRGPSYDRNGTPFGPYYPRVTEFARYVAAFSIALSMTAQPPAELTLF